MQIKYELEQGAKAPTRAHPTDAGWDLYMWRKDPNVSGLVDTGVHVLIPEGYVGLVLPRSSVNKKYWITPVGVIDAGYTGTIKVVQWQPALDKIPLYSDLWFVIKNKDSSPYYLTVDGRNLQKTKAIAQLVILPIPQIELVEGKVSGIDTLRGNKGFGSSDEEA